MKNTFGVLDLMNNLSSGKVMFDSFIDSDSAAAAEIRFLLSKMIDAAKNKNDGWTMMLHGCIFEIYYQLISNKLYHTVQREQSSAPMFMRRVLKYLNAHDLSEVSCRDASAYCNYSEEYFCRMFKKNFGETFIDYLNKYRINSAKRIIDSSPSLPIIKIVELVGFSNSSYFSKLFKKIIGVTPTEYIENRLNQSEE